MDLPIALMLNCLSSSNVPILLILLMEWISRTVSDVASRFASIPRPGLAGLHLIQSLLSCVTLLLN